METELVLGGIYNKEFRRKINLSLSKGLFLPIYMINSILLTPQDKEKLEFERNKIAVLKFIKENKGTYTSEICDSLSIDIINLRKILNQLKAEGKINIK